MTSSNPPDQRRHAPATARNKTPIFAILSRVLPPEGVVLEVASGTGEHAVFLASALPALIWQPTDPDPLALASIAAHRQAAGPPNLRSPVQLDASQNDWPVEVADAIVCINMIHIAPWSACEGLMMGAARVLPPDGRLYLYGPFLQAGVPTADSNLRFDADLRARNPAWGIRDLSDVDTLAKRHGLGLEEVFAMPANNLSVVFRNKNRAPQLTER